ncbi:MULTISPECIES: hypothetical protein [unclassified Mesorhizobium]|uniref:hypothetical protein n=1 Tax=unclassified Mesorhizobium TaxID=325217 RepID=UPI0015E3F369|nr:MULTISPECIES: hypothetical protein [unclassified Mesorhizobium]
MTFILWPGRFRARPFSYLRRESTDQTGEALGLHLDVDPFTGSGPVSRRLLEYFALEPQARFPRYPS